MPVTQTTSIGPTPAGGVRETWLYQDDDGQPVDINLATRAEVIEYDAQGNQIMRRYLTIGRVDLPNGG